MSSAAVAGHVGFAMRQEADVARRLKVDVRAEIGRIVLLSVLPSSANMYPLAAIAVSVAGSLGAVLLIFKPFYEKYVRRDTPVDPLVSPVLAKLKRPVHASHRGGSRLWPENTMLAFRNVVKATSDNGTVCTTQMLEFDIQKSKDGHLVIMHNLQVDDTTNGKGLVADYTFEELRKLDAAYWFTPDSGKSFPFRGQGHQIPSLNEVLTEFAPCQELVLYLDFKAANAVEDALKLVKKLALEERIICGAIPTLANLEIRKQRPPCVPVTPDKNTMVFLYAMYLLGLLWLAPLQHEIVGTTAHRWGFKVLTPGMIKAFHDRKRWMAVFGDYLDNAEGQLDCLALGVDLLVSDRPDILHNSISKWKQAHS
eukprot:SM000180S03502  [mRNA]  locus=s180:111400:114792:+ [translate_table: standard]